MALSPRLAELTGPLNPHGQSGTDLVCAQPGTSHVSCRCWASLMHALQHRADTHQAVCICFSVHSRPL